jgi:hypothetical protein
MTHENHKPQLRNVVIAVVALAAIKSAIRSSHRMHAAGVADGDATGWGPRGRHGGRRGRGMRGLPPRMDAMLRDWHTREHEHTDGEPAGDAPAVSV